jgi:hypothetical protein
MDTSENKEQVESISQHKLLKRPRRCEICGAIVSHFNMRRHLKTKKHIDSIYIQFHRFEIL